MEKVARHKAKDWGMAGWTVAFSWTKGNPFFNAALFQKSLKTMPYFLPCQNPCGSEGKKFLHENDWKINSIKNAATARFMILEFYHDVMLRKAQECRESVSKMCEYNLERSFNNEDKLKASFFMKRFDFPSLWIMDAYFFYILCMLGCEDQASYEKCLDWIEECEIGLNPVRLFHCFPKKQTDILKWLRCKTVKTLAICPSISSLIDLLFV